MEKEPTRCGWVPNNDPQYIKYHDEEWGRPIRDSVKLFEMLCLEGQQAGLSWKTILHKRENYRNAFHNFNPDDIINISDNAVEKLSENSGIVRHKAKIKAIINNAKAYLKLKEDGIDFSEFIWAFVDDTPIVNNWKTHYEVPTETTVSAEMAKELKRRKFSYVGSTICYAYMQACGLVNDHIVDCFARCVTDKYNSINK